MSDDHLPEMITVVTDAYDSGWHDALVAVAQMLQAVNLTKGQCLEVVEKLRDNPPPKEPT